MASRKKLYEEHLDGKLKKINHLLEKEGFPHFPDKVLPSQVDTGYRNRAKFKIFRNRGKVDLKATDPLLGEVPGGEALWILPEWGRRLVEEVIDRICSRTSRYKVDGFEIQLSHGRPEAHLILSVNKEAYTSFTPLANILLDEIVELKGVAIPSQRISCGNGFMEHQILGETVCSHHAAFFQSNIPLTPKLLGSVQAILQEKSFARIIDLYCGCGLFSLFGLPPGGKVLGCDNNPYAIESAIKNVETWGAFKAEYYTEEVEQFLEETPLNSGDFVIIDPPRSGCQESVIRKTANFWPKYVCSVSCHFQTHIRDLCLWRDLGYAVRPVAAFDMFPFTEFIETVVLLERPDSDPE